MMIWEQFTPWKFGTCTVGEAEAVECPYEIGSVTTGRQRVFHSFYVKIALSTGHDVVSRDRHSVRMALLGADLELRKLNLILLIVGTQPAFYESGLSANSGYGYLPTVDRAVHMMETLPTELLSRNI